MLVIKKLTYPLFSSNLEYDGVVGVRAQINKWDNDSEQRGRGTCTLVIIGDSTLQKFCGRDDPTKYINASMFILI